MLKAGAGLVENTPAPMAGYGLAGARQEPCS